MKIILVNEVLAFRIFGFAEKFRNAFSDIVVGENHIIILEFLSQFN